jgi:AbiV family abortive infection protein
MVTANFLLEGAYYALEQCGLLLRDAVQLYNGGSYATAVVLAAFAREELGREKILLALRARVLKGDTISVDGIKDQCADHVEKQRAGMLSIQMYSENDKGGLGRLLRTKMTTRPQSQEWKDADVALTKLDQTLQRRTPDDRHGQRAAALYVEPRSAHQWNRPTETSQLVAFHFIQSATNDYTPERDRRTIMRGGDDANGEIFDAIAKWTDRPELPLSDIMRSPWP